MIFIFVIVTLGVSIGGGIYFQSVGGGFILFGLCVVILGSISIVNGITNFSNEHVATCHVTGKDRGGDNGTYRVYTSDCGVLANSDMFLHGKYNSADIWQQIPSKGVITVDIVGVRNGFFSWFPNILSVEKSN